MRKEKSVQQVYIESHYQSENEIQLKARAYSEKIGLEGISISSSEARLIQFISQLIRPQKIVEIGTLTGLSADYFLRILPLNGKLWTFEKSEEHYKLASEVLAEAIQKRQCEIILGDAQVKLPEITVYGPFDVIFIDGNKAAYYNYWQWAKNNIRHGGLIIIDNVFLAGSVWGDRTQQKFSDKQIQTVKTMTEEIIKDKNFNSTFIPTEEGLLLAQFI